MLGWTMAIYSGGSVEVKEGYGIVGIKDGRCLLYVPATSNIGLLNPIEAVAIETLCASGYPYLYTARAGDLPYTLDVPDDEIVYIEAWDQS